MNQLLYSFQEMYNEGHKFIANQKYSHLIDLYLKLMLLYDFFQKNEYSMRIFWDLAFCFDQLKNYHEAIFFYNLALEYWKDVDRSVQRFLYYRLAQIHYFQRNWKQSQICFQKAEKIFKKARDLEFAQQIHYWLACIDVKMNDFEQARKKLTSIFHVNERLKNEAKKDEDLAPLFKFIEI